MEGIVSCEKENTQIPPPLFRRKSSFQDSYVVVKMNDRHDDASSRNVIIIQRLRDSVNRLIIKKESKLETIFLKPANPSPHRDDGFGLVGDVSFLGAGNEVTRFVIENLVRRQKNKTYF